MPDFDQPLVGPPHLLQGGTPWHLQGMVEIYHVAEMLFMDCLSQPDATEY